MDDRYRNNPNSYQDPQGGSNTYSTFREGGDQGGYYGSNEYPAQDEDAASDATEGHDDEDEIYEGEYQGIPHPDDIRANKKAAQAQYEGQGDRLAERMQDQEQLAHQYEAIIEECSHGRFQWTLFFVAGLALMADGVECFVVGFVMPSAEKDMCMSNANKGMLVMRAGGRPLTPISLLLLAGLIVYLGMMLGAFMWGGLADKMGRRKCLIIALAINSVFAFISSFVQGYGLFLFFRLVSGFGIGGSIPIVYSYFSEFLCREKRGEHLSWLCMFWMIGGIYASSMAWGIIPHYGWGSSMGTSYQFHSWRVFVLVCTLPAISSLIGLIFMPESPRFLLEVSALKHFKPAMCCVSQIKTLKQEDEFIEIQSSTGTWHQRWFVRIMTVVKQVCQNVLSLLSPQFRMNTLFMAVVWFTMAFSYYGLAVWFPDMIKHLQNEEYESKVKVFYRERVEHFTFNFTLENQIHKEGKYFNDKFYKIDLKSVTFEDSLFEECYFEDIRSTDTVFKNCTIVSTVFYNTDLYKHKFIKCKFENSTFLQQKEGCHLDFNEENDILIYLVSFLGSLAVLPGNIISALFMDKIGRIKMIGGSMLISSVCTFFLFFGSSESAIIGWQCLFCGTSVAAWNGIEVITVELYPTSKRATAFGVLNGLCKFAAILGSFIFASFVGITKVMPILLASTALVAGGLLALRLPETREQVLM
ncbi:SV2B protein, partial [Polyodon spathula]|nr:SV2B protein [Polyodon spathula]